MAHSLWKKKMIIRFSKTINNTRYLESVNWFYLPLFVSNLGTKLIYLYGLYISIIFSLIQSEEYIIIRCIEYNLVFLLNWLINNIIRNIYSWFFSIKAWTAIFNNLLMFRWISWNIGYAFKIFSSPFLNLYLNFCLR